MTSSCKEKGIIEALKSMLTELHAPESVKLRINTISNNGGTRTRNASTTPRAPSTLTAAATSAPSTVISSQLSIIPFLSPPPPRSPPRFKLPSGWRVKQIIRSSGGRVRVDRYYVESGTGYKLRSRKEVGRYIKGEPIRLSTGSTDYRERVMARTRSGAYRIDYRDKNSQHVSSRKMIVSGGKMIRLPKEESNKRQLAIVAQTSVVATSSFNLPDGWVVEEVPRRLGNYVDKYYYEPGTKRRFRSLVAVEKHLSELNENSPLSLAVAELRENNTPISKVFKISSRIKNRGSSKNSTSKNKDQTARFPTPPSKVNWVMASSGGDSWNAFIGETIVSEPVKQQWEKRFMLSINENQQTASNSGQ